MPTIGRFFLILRISIVALLNGFSGNIGNFTQLVTPTNYEKLTITKNYVFWIAENKFFYSGEVCCEDPEGGGVYTKEDREEEGEG